MPDEKQKSFQKANAAMRQFVQSWRFIVIIVVIGLIFAAGTFYYAPDFIDKSTLTIYRVAMPIIGGLLTLLVSWLVFLATASDIEIKEEPEEAKSEPPKEFVPDMDKFVNCLTEALDAAYNCLQLKYLAAVLRASGHQTAQGITEESQRAAEKYGQLRERLEDESVAIIGRDGFEQVGTEFQELVSLFDADAAVVYGDKRPDVDVAAHKFRYNKALKAVIEKYDSISQQPQELEPPTSAS